MCDYNFNNIVADLLVAYDNASKNKRNKDKRLRFDLNFEEEIVELAKSIEGRSYEIRPSTCFIVNKPVKREIIAANFRDRIVHHYIYDFLNPFLEKYLIYDCYSCREKKGTSFGINRLEHHIRSCSDNYSKSCYVLQLDILGYFMNINRSILFEKAMRLMNKIRLSERNISQEKFDINAYLIEKVIFNDPLKNAIFRESPEERQGLPQSKSLKYSPANCGLPIGNLTSQLFSNLYLNDFDHYVKRVLSVKHYGRYVDDFYLVDCCKKRLCSMIAPISRYLEDSLSLRIHPNKIRVTEVKKGIVFLGIHQKPYRRYVKNKTLKNIMKNISDLNQRYAELCCDVEAECRILSVVNSYFGILNDTKSFNIKKDKMIRNMIALRFGYGDRFLKKLVKCRK